MANFPGLPFREFDSDDPPFLEIEPMGKGVIVAAYHGDDAKYIGRDLRWTNQPISVGQPFPADRKQAKKLVVQIAKAQERDPREPTETLGSRLANLVTAETEQEADAAADSLGNALTATPGISNVEIDGKPYGPQPISVEKLKAELVKVIEFDPATDVVVLKVDSHLSQRAHESIRESVVNALGKGARAIVLEEGMDLAAVLRKKPAGQVIRPNVATAHALDSPEDSA